MTDHPYNSRAWIRFCYLSFIVALGMNIIGVWLMDEPLATKGFFMMGLMFLTGSCFTLAKTLRDEDDARRNRPDRESDREKPGLRDPRRRDYDSAA